MTELLPCPFCNHSAQHLNIPNYSAVDTGCFNLSCPCMPKVQSFSKSYNTRKWNERRGVDND